MIEFIFHLQPTQYMVSEEKLSVNHRRQTFPLGKAQRRFLYNGDIGSYDSRAEIRGKINDKMSQLEERIQDLIDDLCLLRKDGILEETNDWNDITRLNIKKEFRSQQIPFQPNLAPQHPSVSTFPDHAEFGFVMGRLVSNLYAGVDGEEHYKDLMWGVTVGLMGRTADERHEEYKNRETVLDWLQNLSELRYQRLRTEGSYYDSLAEFETKMKSSGYDIVVPSNSGTAIRRDEIPHTPALEELFVRLHDNLNSDEIPVDRISNIVNDLNYLHSRIDGDIRTLKAHSAHGVEAADVFNQLYENSGESSNELSRIGHGTGYKEEYGKILTDMTGEGKDGYLFEDCPLVRKRSGSTTPTYELTPYGALVGYCLFSVQDIREWLHDSFFLPDTETGDTELPLGYSTERELIQLGIRMLRRSFDAT